MEGRLTTSEPPRIDSVVDLAGRYVVPPFGDAHTHNLDRAEQLPEKENDYLDEGVFYVQVLTNYASGAAALRPHYAEPATVDVAFANAGWTSTLGHPYMYYEPMELGFPPEEWREHYDEVYGSRAAEGDAYYFADTPAAADSLWPTFVATAPDMVKIFLKDVAAFKPLAYGDELNSVALSAPVARRVAELAERDGLRLYAHVETVDDYRLGLDIGVDVFTHLPGFRWDGSEEGLPRIALTDDLIRETGRRGIAVIPTVSISSEYAVRRDEETGEEVPDPEREARQQEHLKSTVRRLKDAGATIALGSDHASWSMTPVIEYHRDAGLFTPLELLRHLSVVTPQHIFPDRGLGELREGRPASFLVLGADPLASSDALLDVELRVKEGDILP